ncbi:MAG: protein kinase [Verrucomicrobia bacterium]|nr:protein kinase [Verrucomicrobiota bacterium]
MAEVERYQQYEVLRRTDGSLWELGRGAMGITYKAFDTNLHCPVALKVINSTYLQNETARQRFLREARAAAALRHPNVASVFNLSTNQDNFFYVMEFIDGETVEALVKRKGSLEPIEALNITLQVARALAAAAKQRLVHRDLKPANLMLVDQEGESVVKVIDFGLAKSAKDSNEESAALTVGGFVGTPHFASPEQVEEGDLDVRSDIYSLGATLYFILTGKPPFSGSVGQVMSQHLYKAISIEPLAGVPPCVIALLQNMLEKDRAKRPQTPRDLQDAIATCFEEIRSPSPRIVTQTSAAPLEPFSPGTFVQENYRLIEPLGERPQGQYFLVEDLRRNRLARQLALKPEFISDPHWYEPLELAVTRLRSAPHPLLREVYYLENAPGEGILVEEHVIGPSLLDFLKARSILSAPEVVHLATLLAPLADHASASRLEYVDLSLSGIHFVNWEPSATEPALSERSLLNSENLELKVDGLDFSFTSSQAGTLVGLDTMIASAAVSGPRASYVRSLSLLSYELLGGPRTRVEATGQYKPIAALTQEGNTVLKRGLVDDFPSAVELAKLLAAAANPKEFTSEIRGDQPTATSRQAEKLGSITSVSKSAASEAQEAVLGVPPSTTTSELPSKRSQTPARLRLGLAIALIALIGVGGYLIYPRLRPAREIAALSIQSDPPGASVLLDGKPPQTPPNTFTHVPFGLHHITASLDNYEPLKQDLEVRKGMVPGVRLKLTEKQEIAALAVQTDPAGASIFLDGKPPQTPPKTFEHVPFGTHQLTAALDGYELAQQELQVRSGMSPNLYLKLNRKLSPTEKFLGEVKQAREGSPQQLNAYVHLAQLSAPDSGEYTKELEKLIEQLRTKAPPITSAEFNLSYKDTIKAAADLNIIPAILWLAENEQGNGALDLFLRAAKLGNSYAMLRAGRAYLRKGTPSDNEEGFKLLNQAYNAPDRNLEAGAYIGDCYLSGVGTQRDLQKAEDIILPLANQNVVPAMTIAGRILAVKSNNAVTEAQKAGTTPERRKQLQAEADDLARQAVTWWERALEKGDWNASAHLGQCAELGWGGVNKSEEEAEKRYKEGADHGNPISTFYYGLAIQNKPGRRAEAEEFISKAAGAGIPSAIKWCKDNNVSFTQSSQQE